jgi:3,4-dihydroxy 2-butanone 4-phosphate synthase/GTP cyclohydrolase II
MSLQLNTVEEAIEDIKNGKIVLVFDDVARENEGDFIAAAELATPEIINFMAKYGRGLICAALTEERCNELQLERMVQSNTALMTTNFTVSVDLKGYGCTTGISASDRSKTVKALVDVNTKPEELARPGHIFPLIAHPEGVLGRMGHTEASVDLPLLAGLKPAGVLVEVMNDDGTMARWNDLVEVAKQHDMKLISITQIKEFRKHNQK